MVQSAFTIIQAPIDSRISVHVILICLFSCDFYIHDDYLDQFSISIYFIVQIYNISDERFYLLPKSEI